MNRYWYGLIGIVLLASMIGGGVWYVCEVTNKMEGLVKEAEQQLTQKNDEEALRLLKESDALWKKKLNGLEMILDHSAVEQVSISLAEASSFLQYKKRAHCAASCQTILQTLHALRDGQRAGFYNLF